jgi:hypothetical protein
MVRFLPCQFASGRCATAFAADWSYTQLATNVIRAIMSPLDRLTPLTAKRPEPPA